MTYAEKLKDPRWQKKRLEIMQRDEFTCQFCKEKEKTLHVHHKSYIYGKEPWDYNDNNFITLCYECHSMEEYFKDSYTDLIHDMKMMGFTNRDLYRILWFSINN